jgi:hypothetical protein
MIMNTAGGKKVVDEDKDQDQDKDKDKDENDSTKRKRAIYDVVTNTRAALVLFQEFHWKSIHSRGWKDHSWPEHLCNDWNSLRLNFSKTHP